MVVCIKRIPLSRRIIKSNELHWIFFVGRSYINMFFVRVSNVHMGASGESKSVFVVWGVVDQDHSIGSLAPMSKSS